MITGTPDVTIRYDGSSSHIYDRVLKINDALIVTIDGVTIRGGCPWAAAKDGAGIAIGSGGITTIRNSHIMLNGDHFGGYVYRGGGISNRGILYIENCEMKWNNAEKGGAIYNTGSGYVGITQTEISLNELLYKGRAVYGGGIYNDVDATISLNRVELRSNSIEVPTCPSESIEAKGAGIYNLGSMTVINSRISVNEVKTQSGGRCGHAGGIYNAGEAVIRRTYLGSNESRFGGGAILNIGGMKILNSTFYGNQALVGGAIWNATYTLDSGLDIRNCTFNRNNGTPDSIYYEIAGNTYIYNTIFCESPSAATCIIAPGGGDLEDIRQVITDVEDGWGSYFADIKLEDPADNGGPTQTCALMRGSPAINFGDTDFLESIMTTDQRGQGYPRIIGEPWIAAPMNIRPLRFYRRFFFSSTTEPCVSLTIAKNDYIMSSWVEQEYYIKALRKTGIKCPDQGLV